jgi:Chaperone of endosialidase
MKPQNLILILILIGCVGPSPRVEAVNPPPDGGYPGFNTAEGQNALLSLTTGAANTAVGWFSLRSNTDGSFNTGVGAGTLLFNVGDQITGEGTENTAIGAAALLFNTGGFDNTAVGAAALLNNTTGFFNTAVGTDALESNTTGESNTAVGRDALANNSTGGGNTAVGRAALLNNTTGESNTTLGRQALLSNETGSSNTAVGRAALASNSAGFGHTAVGYRALESSTASGQFCFANTAVGSLALGNNTSGCSNTAIGGVALASNTSGSSNVAVGLLAGDNVTTADNVICIGTDVQGENVSNSCYIGNIWNQQSFSGQTVFVNSDGKLGNSTSSRRFKDEIKPMDKASEALLALQPVTFRYKKEFDPSGAIQFGLVAEDVERVNPDLVVRDKAGKPNSVRYDQVNAMLLNEFLKEHRKNEEQEATIARQQKQIEALTAGLQKVSAQLQASRHAEQIAANDW